MNDVLPYPCVVYSDGSIHKITDDQVDKALEEMLFSDDIETVIDEWGDKNHKNSMQTEYEIPSNW